jgi:hypothetical protein
MASAAHQPDPRGNDGDFPPPESFGARLAAALAIKGWTLARAAQEISRHLPPGEVFNPVNLSHYVHGRSFPRPKYRRALMRALDLGDVSEETVRQRQPAIAAPSEESSEAPNIKVQDMGNGRARVQIDQVVPWPDALRLLQVLTYTHDG